MLQQICTNYLVNGVAESKYDEKMNRKTPKYAKMSI